MLYAVKVGISAGIIVGRMDFTWDFGVEGTLSSLRYASIPVALHHIRVLIKFNRNREVQFFVIRGQSRVYPRVKSLVGWSLRSIFGSKGCFLL